MLLKDCPVGSMVRLVSICGESVNLPYWTGEFEVKKSYNKVYVTDADGDDRHDLSNDPDFQFEIVRSAPTPAPDPRVTFTVGGQEFYVGQRVWSNFDYTCAPKGVAFEVIGHYNEFVATRVENTSSVALMDIPSLSTTPPAPHEWKRGDWARHDEHGVLFVAGKSNAREGALYATDKNGFGHHLWPSELTFISHSEPPE